MKIDDAYENGKTYTKLTARGKLILAHLDYWLICSFIYEKVQALDGIALIRSSAC